MGSVIKSLEIEHRNEFPLLCDWRKLETAIEVGVDRGTFSQLFFNNKRLRHFIGVDNYENYSECPYSRVADVQIAASRFATCLFASLMTASSVAIADAIGSGELGHIKEKCVDFVYIDASHEYEAVQQDIAAWWPLISQRGILAGHDYDVTHPDVMRAVDEFALHNDLVIYTTHELCNSWYCYKSGTTPEWKRV